MYVALKITKLIEYKLDGVTPLAIKYHPCTRPRRSALVGTNSRCDVTTIPRTA